MNYTDQQIKKMMAARKRELARVSRSFPKWAPGMSTATYVADYIMRNYAGMGVPLSGNNLRASAARVAAELFEPLNVEPAAYIAGPEVIEEVEA